MTSKNIGLLPVVSFIGGSILSFLVVYFLQSNLHHEQSKSVASDSSLNLVAKDQIDASSPNNSTDNESNSHFKKIIAKQANTY